MKSSIVVILALIFSAIAPAGAQGAGRFCAPTSAEETSIAEIAANPQSFIGKCVTLAGVYSDERLYADADAIYGVNANAIGGYVDGKGSMEGFWTGQFTGRVADCAVAEGELTAGLLRSPGISLNGRTLGCIEPKGPFLLFMSQRDLTPAKLVRRVAETAAGAGDLKPAAADWPHLAAVQKTAGDFLAALRARDRSALHALGMRDYEAEQLFTSETTAIAYLRKPAERPMQVFTSGASSDASFRSEACYCRAKTCAATWPIARRDADNQSSRPYACVRVDGSKSGGAWTYSVDAAQDFSGLPEPVASRMR
jgi:hypothetical protein